MKLEDLADEAPPPVFQRIALEGFASGGAVVDAAVIGMMAMPLCFRKRWAD